MCCCVPYGVQVQERASLGSRCAVVRWCSVLQARRRQKPFAVLCDEGLLVEMKSAGSEGELNR